jgi:hypothetical protein
MGESSAGIVPGRAWPQPKARLKWSLVSNIEVNYIIVGPGIANGGSAHMEPEKPAILEAGNTYIVDEALPRLSVALFDLAVGSGRDGLYFTSEPVDHARRHLAHPERVDVVWVTDITAAGAIKPAMVEQLNARRERFLDKHQRSVMLLDIFPSLTSANDFGNVFKFLSIMRDDTHQRDSVIIISLDSQSLEPSEFRKVRRLAREIFSDENPPDLMLPEAPLVEGSTYLLKAGEKRGYRMALEAFASGKRVLCITRGFPDNVRRTWSLPEAIELCWLTRTGHPGALRADHMPELAQRVQRFLSPGNGLILLDGLDILIAENGFTEFYTSLSHIKDLTRLTRGVLLVVLPPTTLNPDEMRKLAQEAEIL